MTKPNQNPLPDLRQVLPDKTFALLEGIGGIAGEMGAKAYLVGGLVRDMFLGVDNVDLDVSIVGDGLAFARRLGRSLNARVLVHERFLTATLVVPGEIKVDIATARAERYEQPGALPRVLPASLEEDLFRRDITINAMAVSLGPGDFGAMVDPYGGTKDLEAGLVRILHPASLRDDPTRILRIIRFAARFGFEVEENTGRCLEEALEERVLGRISAERLRAEIFLSLAEPDPAAVFGLMKEKGVMAQVLPGINFDEDVASAMLRGQRLSALVARDPDWEPEWVQLILLMHRSPRTAIGRVLAGLNLRGRTVKVPGQAWRLDVLERRAAGLNRQSELHEALQGASLEMQLALLAKVKSEGLRRRLLRYITQSRRIRPELTGDDVKALGYPKGPGIKKVLAAIRAQKMDGKLGSRKAEEEFAVKSLRGADDGNRKRARVKFSKGMKDARG